jgi:hypothetical protein
MSNGILARASPQGFGQWERSAPFQLEFNSVRTLRDLDEELVEESCKVACRPSR